MGRSVGSFWCAIKNDVGGLHILGDILTCCLGPTCTVSPHTLGHRPAGPVSASFSAGSMVSCQRCLTVTHSTQLQRAGSYGGSQVAGSWSVFCRLLHAVTATRATGSCRSLAQARRGVGGPGVRCCTRLLYSGGGHPRRRVPVVDSTSP